jgi:predicted TIM-barrel fold metal-dependent hydrolase
MTITDGIPAIDHHSHASAYGARSVRAIQEQFATALVEANVPLGVYEEFIRGRKEGDLDRLAELEQRHGTTTLLERGLAFRDTTFFTRALCEGSRRLHGGPEGPVESRAAAGQMVPAAASKLYDRAVRIAGTPVLFTDVAYIDRSEWDPGTYRQVLRIDPYLYPFGHAPRERRGTEFQRFLSAFDGILANELQLSGSDDLPAELADYVAFVHESLDRRLANGVVGLKLASAYLRSLRFGRPDEAAAAAEYRQLSKSAESPREHVEDFLLHVLARYALARDLPLQVHIGTGHPEPGLLLTNADPAHLEGLISAPELARLRIVLLHGGYPFSNAAAALAQTYGNVFLDFSWMPYLHYHFLRRVLREWLEFLPADKLIFGSDAGSPEFHVAAAVFGRDALDKALEGGHADGVWDARQTEWLAERVLAGNAADVYGIEPPASEG